MNILQRKETVKNSKTEEYDQPQDLSSLQKWTIPRIDPKIIYQYGVFEKLGLKTVVKTTEESIPLRDKEFSEKLLEKTDLDRYKNNDYKFIHIGLVQIAFKPLTLDNLPESFMAVLRDGRNRNYKKSIMGIIESSLAYGPVYFNIYPNLSLSLTDPNITKALTLDVKTHGFDYDPDTEIICVLYRIYFKPSIPNLLSL